MTEQHNPPGNAVQKPAPKPASEVKLAAPQGADAQPNWGGRRIKQNNSAASLQWRAARWNQ